MTTDPPSPTVRLTIENPTTLLAVEQWAELAHSIGMDATTEVHSTVTGHLVASAYLHHLAVSE